MKDRAEASRVEPLSDTWSESGRSWTKEGSEKFDDLISGEYLQIQIERQPDQLAEEWNFQGRQSVANLEGGDSLVRNFHKA